MSHDIDGNNYRSSVEYLIDIMSQFMEAYAS